ncbi:MAG: hypothetical protein JXA20_19210 [Spirochaetes bacterium]|nr:hypothetical protein [Spirochaetota bacterium]
MKTGLSGEAPKQLFAAVCMLLVLASGGAFLSAEDCDDGGATERKYDGYASADNVRMRERPCTQSGSKGFLKIGTALYCKKRSAAPQEIGGKRDHWYRCDVSDGTGGWVFGAFIRSGSFDKSAYLGGLPAVKGRTPLFAKLANTSWNDCNPAEEANRGCEVMNIGDRTVSFNMISETVYRIQEMSEKGGELHVRAQLVLSENLVEKTSDLAEFVIRFGSDPGVITVDGREFYK